MAKTAVYWQRGESIDYKNNADTVIPANTVVLVGKKMGIAGTDIMPGETGSLHMVGVFEIQKKSGVVLEAGDNIVFTDEDGIDKAISDVMGYAVEAAAAGAASVKVKLMG